MNENYYCQCSVCETIVNIKFQVGYIDVVPISYQCPECGITISGEISTDQKNISTKLSLFNCINMLSAREIGYCLQISSEFFTPKISLYGPLTISPFIEYSMMVREPNRKEKLDRFRILVPTFSKKLINQWHIAKRIFELYRSSNGKLLFNELKKLKLVDSKTKYIQFKEKQQNEAITKSILKVAEPIETTIPLKKEMYSLLENLRKQKRNEFRDVVNHFNDSYNENITALIDLIGQFVDYHKYIMPIILADLFDLEKVEDIKESKGLTSVNFERLKDNYVSSYEVLGNIYPVILALQNLNFRGNMNSFNPDLRKDFPNINSIEDYKKMRNKGNKLKFFNNEEKISLTIRKCLDNDIRNSLGHYTYKTENNQQLIHFLDLKRQPVKSLYLIEFAEMLYNTFKLALVFLEILSYMKSYNIETNAK